MAVFGIEIERSKEAFKFITETNKRLQLEGDIGRNPFYGRAYILMNKSGVYGIFKMEPVYIKAYLGGLFLLIPALIFSKFTWTWWYIPGLALLSLGIFWSKYFYWAIATLGLKKSGYIGKKRLIKTSELLDILTT